MGSFFEGGGIVLIVIVDFEDVGSFDKIVEEVGRMYWCLWVD